MLKLAPLGSDGAAFEHSRSDTRLLTTRLQDKIRSIVGREAVGVKGTLDATPQRQGVGGQQRTRPALGRRRHPARPFGAHWAG